MGCVVEVGVELGVYVWFVGVMFGYVGVVGVVVL